MESKRLSTLKGADKYGTCVECGTNSKEEDLIRISFMHGTSITVCKHCAKQLGIIAKSFGERP